MNPTLALIKTLLMLLHEWHNSHECSDDRARLRRRYGKDPALDAMLEEHLPCCFPSATHEARP